MAEAPVEVVAYDPRWPVEFERESELIAKALAPWLVGPVAHIGSTAVPGLSAKPVIDIMAPVESLSAAWPAIAAAQQVGYVHFPYKPELMHWFCKPSPALRTHHLHLVPTDTALWRERLAFRNALRADPDLRAEYQALKLRLANQHGRDREAYTEAKSPFVAKVLHALQQGGKSAA
ncbi:MAG: GrpB family protein [Rubrivivax sp.]|nr:GrpB family protein [Rubrivivax sp.]